MSQRPLAAAAVLVLLGGPGVIEARAQGAASAREVQTQMRNVDFHIDASIVLHVDYLRGALQPTSGGAPFFDDKRSFRIGIDTATVRVTTASLSDLLNRYVFAFPGSPLRNLRVTAEGGRLRQRATAHGIPVTLVSEVSVTKSGDIRLHPVSIKAVGVPVRGLMHLIGLHLEKLVSLGKARGVRLDGNDMLLSVNELLPPPTIRGHLVSARVALGEIIQVFGPSDGKAPPALPTGDPGARNYMYYRGGVLRFGRLTMTGADLLIVDADQKDPFDFFLDRYQRQLVRGYSKTTPSQGLIAFMPDFADVPAARP